MITLLLIGIFILVIKLISLSIRAAWGITNLIFFVIGFPVILLVLLAVGLIYLAVPLLIIGLILSFVLPKHKG